MSTPRQHKRKDWPFLAAVFLLAGFVAWVAVQFLTQTGWFMVPGEITYDASLTSTEIEKLQSIFTEDVILQEDLTISATESTSLAELSDNEQLVGISVPVTDFYSAETDIAATDLGDEANDVELIPLAELDNSRKLLSIDGYYYLDELDRGAVFRVIKFTSDAYESEIAPLVSGVFATMAPSHDTVLTFAQTGVTALSRGMLTKLNTVGDATYFTQNIKDFLANFDLTHTSNESSFTDFATSENICSDPRFFETLISIGLDIVDELTGNHNQDCGDDAANDSIDLYLSNNIQIVGGGKTADAAKVPLVIDKKNTEITFLAYNLSTGGATYDNTPGANQYYEDDAAVQIAAAKAKGDLVIVDVQYYECSEYASEIEDATCDAAGSAAGDQVGLFRHLVDLGADVVVGTSAHQPQTFELYGDRAIYYGLGNLFFDQIWWPGTTRSLILAHYFYDGKLLQTRIVPTVYDDMMQTELMDAETAEWFIERLASARP